MPLCNIGKPLIVLCGTTGVGKSKLAIELALMLAAKRDGAANRARIINADSMQVYKGMDIITNKVPDSQRCGVEHLLMDFKDPGEQYVVGQWVQDAIRLVRIAREVYSPIICLVSLNYLL